MTIKINFDNTEIDNFSKDAQSTLKKQIENYTDSIIKEANLIEEANREDGASTEITSNIVLLAVRKNKMNHGKKSNKFLLSMKIISTFSLLITGFLFDSNGYQGAMLKLIAFIICIIVATLSTVLQFVLEDKE